MLDIEDLREGEGKVKSWMLSQTLLSRTFLIFFLVGCTELWERISNGEVGFMIPKLDSLVGEIGVCVFFWIKLTKHHKITTHCTFIHEPFLSFSTSENISLHWNMNGNLKLVSWITHPQPFSPTISPTYEIWRQWERSFTVLVPTFFPPCMSEVVAAIIWECRIYRKGKISK